MKTNVTDNTLNSRLTSPWHQSAVGIAIVAGAFSLIVTALLVSNYVKRTGFDAQQSSKVDALKIELLGQPDNQQLIAQIRELDLQIRQNKIRRQDFSKQGSYLLLGGVLVLVLTLKWAAARKINLPAPKAQGDTRDRQLRDSAQARWAVTAALLLLGTLVLFLLTSPQIDLKQAAAGPPSYPSTEEISKNWPRFRGPGGLGISPYTNLPADWDGASGEGILWKTKVPLQGHNSPVIWADRVFLSGADENKRQLYCFDAICGNLLWQRRLAVAAPKASEPPEVMEDTGLAAPTVTTDGRRVYAVFANGHVGCFDFNGRQIWAINLGTPDSAYGYASSLQMYRNLLLIQYDQGLAEDEKSRLIALDGFTGRTVWAAKRPVPNSWTSPILTKIDNQHQLITCGDPWVIAYDPANGAELWRAQCLGGDLAPSPIYAGGFVLAVEPYTKLVAIRPDGQGDVTETHIAWTAEIDAPDICSPVGNEQFVFLLTTSGTLICCDLKTGAQLWENDLGDIFKASPSLVADRLYLLSDDGTMFIIQAAAKYKELTRCELGENCNASPAFADGRIYIRGKEYLYCIGKAAPENLDYIRGPNMN